MKKKIKKIILLNTTHFIQEFARQSIFKKHTIFKTISIIKLTKNKNIFSCIFNIFPKSRPLNTHRDNGPPPAYCFICKFKN